VPRKRRRGRSHFRHGRGGPYRIKQLGADQEDDAGAGKRQQQSADAGVGLEIVDATLDRAQGDRISHQPRLGASLDREQPANFVTHRH
jgi:hypothetical protein